MIQVKRISQARMQKAVAERETLTPCPACKGNGYHIKEAGSRYRRTICRWCLGVCGVPTSVHAMFRRAARISGFMGATRLVEVS